MSSDLKLVEYEGKMVPIDYQGLPWMTQKQLADVLGIQQSSISRNVDFAANSKLVIESSKKRNLPVHVLSAYTATDGKTYQVTYYNVFVLISLAMRSRSEEAFNFQMWAMDKLADALVGELQEKIGYLQNALSEESILRLSAENEKENLLLEKQEADKLKYQYLEDWED